MSLPSSSISCNIPISITRSTCRILHTVRAIKTHSTQGANIRRNYGLQYERRIIRNKPTIAKRQVARMYSDTVHSKNSSYKDHNLLYGLYLFARPYTIIGTVLSISSISTLALSSWTQVSPAFLWEVLKAVVPVILMNIYISGINQVYDVEIDKVNKPYLPLASGVMSMKLGTGIVAASLITSLTLGMRYGSPAATVALLCLCLIGSLYSIELPFMRWKRNPFLTAITIIVMRALAIPLGYFIHMQKYVLGNPMVLPRAVIYTSCFMFLFSIVVSMSKDIPDVEGDKIHGFMSFSVSLGKERVFWICVSILMVAYGGAMAIGVSSSSLLNKIVSVLGHFSLAAIVMHRALQVDHLHNFYMLIWKLFYAEYLLIPFMR